MKSQRVGLLSGDGDHKEHALGDTEDEERLLFASTSSLAAPVSRRLAADRSSSPSLARIAEIGAPRLATRELDTMSVAHLKGAPFGPEGLRKTQLDWHHRAKHDAVYRLREILAEISANTAFDAQHGFVFVINVAAEALLADTTWPHLRQALFGLVPPLPLGTETPSYLAALAPADQRQFLLEIGKAAGEVRDYKVLSTAFVGWFPVDASRPLEAALSAVRGRFFGHLPHCTPSSFTLVIYQKHVSGLLTSIDEHPRPELPILAEVEKDKPAATSSARKEKRLVRFTNIEVPDRSMKIINTAFSIAGVTPGFRIWDPSKWEQQSGPTEITALGRRTADFGGELLPPVGWLLCEFNKEDSDLLSEMGTVTIGRSLSTISIRPTDEWKRFKKIRFERICKHCVCPGHWRSACRLLARDVCFQCGVVGHEQTRCKGPLCCINCYGAHFAGSEECFCTRLPKAKPRPRRPKDGHIREPTPEFWLWLMVLCVHLLQTLIAPPLIAARRLLPTPSKMTQSCTLLLHHECC
jgi:hypothetical protein